jgi:hypothetical protein
MLVSLNALLRERFWQVVCSDRIVALHFVLQHAPQVLIQIELMALELAEVRLHSQYTRVCQAPKPLSQQRKEFKAFLPTNALFIKT